MSLKTGLSYRTQLRIRKNQLSGTCQGELLWESIYLLSELTSERGERKRLSGWPQWAK